MIFRSISRALLRSTRISRILTESNQCNEIKKHLPVTNLTNCSTINSFNFSTLPKVKTSKNKIENPKLRKIYKDFGIKEDMLTSNSWLRDVDCKSIAVKLELVQGMNFKCIEDGIAFLKLETRTLVSILKATKNDEKHKYCDNRLYYLSDKLNIEPKTVAPKLSKRIFLYTLSFDWLEASLETCLDYGVLPERILKDLWVLKYNHETIKARFDKVRANGRKDLTPWMVRCTDEVLERSLQLSEKTSEVLGDYTNTQDYLVERLKSKPEVIKEIFDKIPAMKYRRATKFKSILDYLFTQGFTESDILSCARILLHSLSTTRNRYETLKARGIQVTNLNVLCKTEERFSKYLELVRYVPQPGVLNKS